MTNCINILLCDTFPGRLPDFIPNYESLFVDLFDAIGQHPSYRIFQTWQGELPADVNQGELYLIPGSLDSACDDKPWITALMQWIKRAYQRGAKMMGVCFGHQLIARALGGEVRHHQGGLGVGVRASRVTDKKMQAYFTGGTMHLLCSHYDQVTALPPDAVLCATSDFCKIECYRIGHQVIAFQGHPEFTIAYSAHLLNNDCYPGLQDDLRQAALRSLEELHPQGLQAARYALDVLYGTEN